MLNKKVLFLLVGILLISNILSADILTPDQNAIKSIGVNDSSFNFLNFFRNIVSQEYTIVGQARSCDTTRPAKTLSYSYGDLMTIKSSSYCSNNYGLLDMFDKKYNEYGEFKGSMNLYCGDSDGCLVEVYCCPHAECSSDSNCESWVGTGSECETKRAVDPYLPLLDSSLNPITSFKYCTSSCTGDSISCWHINSGVCESRTYDCSYGTYPDCPSSYPYTSLSKCTAALPVDTCGDGICQATETTTSCASDCKSLAVCASGADTNSDGIVSRDELGTYLLGWISGTNSRINLGQAIEEWAGISC